MMFGVVPAATRTSRSEEHTSEPQSLTNLVCRLLLEKKKTMRCSSDFVSWDGPHSANSSWPGCVGGLRRSRKFAHSTKETDPGTMSCNSLILSSFGA